MSSLTKVHELGLAENQLSGSIPTGLLSLKALKQLYLQANQLRGSLDMHDLKFERLLVSENQLTVRLPQDLTRYFWLVANGNMIEGTLPDMRGAGVSSLMYLASPSLSIAS